MLRVPLSSVGLLLLLLGGPASAMQVLEGDFLRVNYNNQGVWNVESDGEIVGLEAIPDGTWVDFTGSGTPWQHVILAYDQGGSTHIWYGTYESDSTNWTVTSEEDVSSSGFLSMQHVIDAGELRLTKTETWASAGAVIDIDLFIENVGSAEVTNVTALFVVDPDQDYDVSDIPDDGRTINDSLDLINEDGDNDWAESIGANSGFSFGLGVCDPSRQEVGHAVRQSSLEIIDYVLADMGGLNSDLVATWRHVEDALAAGENTHARLLAVVGTTQAVGEDLYLANVAACATCDADNDGHEALACSGDDCDDEDATAYTGATEDMTDGIDNDCNGIDDNDDNDLDGVLDEYEYRNGMDYTTRDSDDDGYLDGDEVGADPENPQDSDGDGTIDPLDTDDDNDGVPSGDEVKTDSDQDGLENYVDSDDDGDNIPTSTEAGADPLNPVDSDGDGTEDYLDQDSDADHLTDLIEGVVDTDADGQPNYLDVDSDADGNSDDAEGAVKDQDCDEIVNYIDADDTDGPCIVDEYRGGGGSTCAAAGGQTGLTGLVGLAIAAVGLRRRRAR